MDDANPFQSPGSEETTTVPKRPVSPMVLGIISIVFAVLGVLSSAVGLVAFAIAPTNDEIYEMMGLSKGYVWTTTIFGLLFAFVLLAAGIGLVRYRNWGRVCFNAYAIVTILLTIAQSAYMLSNLFRAEFTDPAMMGGAIGGAAGGLFALILPIVGLIFLNLRSVRESMH